PVDAQDDCHGHRGPAAAPRPRLPDQRGIDPADPGPIREGDPADGLATSTGFGAPAAISAAPRTARQDRCRQWSMVLPPMVSETAASGHFRLPSVGSFKLPLTATG